jgi:predicted N-formylglutamate amidohydrolase
MLRRLADRAAHGKSHREAVTVNDETLIEPSEGPAFAVLRPDGGSDVVLICEHASNTMPKSLGTLGLDGAALESHIAWDIGAQRVAERCRSARCGADPAALFTAGL